MGDTTWAHSPSELSPGFLVGIQFDCAVYLE